MYVVPNRFSAAKNGARTMPSARAPWPGGAQAAQLLREGLVSAHDMVSALAEQAQGSGEVVDILRARRLVPPAALIDRTASWLAVPRVAPTDYPADPRLIDRLGAATCLRLGLLPLVQIAGITLVLTARPQEFARHNARLIEALGPVSMALATAEEIEATILAQRGKALTRAAEACVPADVSCRGFGSGRMMLGLALAAVLVLAALILAPVAVAMSLVVWALVTMVLCMALKGVAGLAAIRAQPREAAPPLIARMPMVSVMVALYRESSIAPRLVARLSKLDYPRDLLEILLVVEAEDHMTRDALATADLPAWMRVVLVPNGRVKTKPRALNFALNHCKGSIVGVYDAEDAPAPDQIRRVVDRFHQRGSEVVCLQGVLDFYNPRANWMSRCFAMEYATWFRMILPGMQRLGLAIPLGGTTLFFRRQVLEEIGGWDAWNVTEDADLGIRLARHGYRSELIDTVTEEEACCRPLPWVKQRSRWLKGYMMTYIVHMRDPARLWRELGPRQFVGFQVLFLCTLTQFLLAPVLWSFWVLLFGLSHPVADHLPPTAMLIVLVLFLLTEAVNLLLGFLALRQTRHRLHPLWLLTLQAYFPLGTLAAYKAAWEVVTKPFYWDKTSHGHF